MRTFLDRFLMCCAWIFSSNCYFIKVLAHRLNLKWLFSFVKYKIGLWCDDRLRKLGLLTLEKRRMHGNLITAIQCQKGPTKNPEMDSSSGPDKK